MYPKSGLWVFEVVPQKFYEIFGMFDDISKAEQEKTLKNQASNMPPKKEAKISFKDPFLNFTFTPIFLAVSGYSIHH